MAEARPCRRLALAKPSELIEDDISIEDVDDDEEEAIEDGAGPTSDS